MGDYFQEDLSEFPPDEGGIAYKPYGYSVHYTSNETQEMKEVVLSLTQENDGLVQKIKDMEIRLNQQIGGHVDNKAEIEQGSLELN